MSGHVAVWEPGFDVSSYGAVMRLSRGRQVLLQRLGLGALRVAMGVAIGALFAVAAGHMLVWLGLGALVGALWA